MSRPATDAIDTLKHVAVDLSRLDYKETANVLEAAITTIEIEFETKDGILHRTRKYYGPLEERIAALETAISAAEDQADEIERLRRRVDHLEDALSGIVRIVEPAKKATPGARITANGPTFEVLVNIGDYAQTALDTVIP